MVTDSDIDEALNTLDTIKRRVDAYDYERVLEVIDVLERCREDLNGD